MTNFHPLHVTEIYRNQFFDKIFKTSKKVFYLKNLHVKKSSLQNFSELKTERGKISLKILVLNSPFNFEYRHFVHNFLVAFHLQNEESSMQNLSELKIERSQTSFSILLRSPFNLQFRQHFLLKFFVEFDQCNKKSLL